jgi:hypothetical protein
METLPHLPSSLRQTGKGGQPHRPTVIPAQAGIQTDCVTRSATKERKLDSGLRGNDELNQIAALNVSQAFGSPLSSPRLSQAILCSELPCVKLSGTTRPWLCL